MADITPAALRAARSLLGIKQIELAQAAQVSEGAIKAYEAGRVSAPHRVTLAAIEAALDRAGVVFLVENGDVVGVRLRSPPSPPPAVAPAT